MYLRVAAGESVDGSGRPLRGCKRDGDLLVNAPGAGMARVVVAAARRRTRD
jgi:hypothetical protein